MRQLETNKKIYLSGFQNNLASALKSGDDKLHRRINTAQNNASGCLFYCLCADTHNGGEKCGGSASKLWTRRVKN